ncbi:MAG: GHKL domain-containing protein [Deltaproteobacteria bacterium]|nr:GHKL domain-containing protein [Deltaproteobacteria bacterium]MBW1959012.1 GHKL domain-containing protein [Deltaproteobacteria bacterium]MBW2088780.1 GHKL domain-containing protein [Deltaproteobacteria bacterium]MBW2320855.1 GHKL domain-containing protein [Deltaproteobacteria bacterium]
MNPGNHKKDPYYNSLTRKMILTVISVSFTPMILVSGAILYQFHVSYHEKVRAHLEELVQKHKQNIDYFLNEKLGEIRFLVENSGFENLRKKSYLEQQLAILQQELDPVFVDLGLVDAEGRQIAYAGPFKLGKAQYSEAEWFKKAIKSKYFISDVFLGLRGLPHFIVAVRKYFQGETWILRATIDFMAFNNLVENVRIGKTGFAFILNKEGEFQTKLLRDVMPSKNTYMELLKNGSKGEDKICIVEAVDDYGKKNIYTSAFLKNGDWMLVCQQNKSDAFSDLYCAKKVAGLIFLLGGLGIITMAILLSRRMVSHIAQADREKDMMNLQVIETGKLATVGELAAGIAHEINNPVAIMVEEAGWVQDLLEEEEFQEGEHLEEFQRALKQINTQGKRCKEITHKLLSFARKTDSRIQVIQINDLIIEAIGLAEQSARYSKVVIHTNLEENLPFIQASQTEIQQVFLNLINNAVDAMDSKSGGTIDITSRLDEDNILINFSDNGPGIHRNNLDRIFDPFFTTKPVGKGTGLGLSICYGIIKKMGGEIDVQSVIDKGTTFNIRIPVPKDLLEESSTS